MYLLAMHWELHPVYYAETNIITVTAVHMIGNTRHV